MVREILKLNFCGPVDLVFCFKESAAAQAQLYYPSPNVSRPASQLTEEEQVSRVLVLVAKPLYNYLCPSVCLYVCVSVRFKETVQYFLTLNMLQVNVF